MENDIIAKFLAKGKLLTPEALEYIRNKRLENILTGNIPGIVITRPNIEKTAGISVLKNLTDKKKEFTSGDFAGFYKTKYEKLKEILLQRMQKNFVSINKIGKNSGEVYVVGIVKDITKNGKNTINIEDMTGSANILLENDEDVELDDVVAVKILNNGGILTGQQVIYPDIPLRSPATGSGKACFISDLHLDEVPRSYFEKFLQWFEKQPVDALFVAGDIGGSQTFEELVSQYCAGKQIVVIPGEKDTEEEYPQAPLGFSAKNITSLSNPAMVEMNGVKILIVHEADRSMLKKRYMGKDKILYSDHLVLDDVPDIMHHGHSQECRVTNYKSITIVNSGSLLSKFAPVVIDFSTREAVQESNWAK